MSDCCSSDTLAALPSSKKPVEKVPRCPFCAQKGKPVKTITLQSLLKPDALLRMDESPYHFCSSPGCDVVYFGGQGIGTFMKRDLTVRVGIKESAAPRPICYCFNHTIEELEEEVRCYGKTRAIEDIKTRMKTACWCETKSPQGACCLATFTKCVQAVVAGRATARTCGKPTLTDKSFMGAI
jgi:hypothetical protein